MSILKKKNPENFKKSISNFFSINFLKRTSIYYFLRLARLEASIYSISAGFACGSMVSFTPFIGFHFILAIVVAFLIRGNILASMIGTIVGNPFTFPFIWITIYNIGIIFFNPDKLNENVELNLDSVLNGGWDILLPMLIGSAIICIPIWCFSYFIIRFLLLGFRKKKI